MTGGAAKIPKIALAKYVLHEHEHIAVIKPVGRALVLNQMRYPSDLRQPGELHLPTDKELNEKEVDMALQLIKQETRPFIPEDLRDTYTEELEEAYQRQSQRQKNQENQVGQTDRIVRQELDGCLKSQPQGLTDAVRSRCGFVSRQGSVGSILQIDPSRTLL